MENGIIGLTERKKRTEKETETSKKIRKRGRTNT